MPISWKDPIPVWASLMGDSSTLKIQRKRFLVTEYLQIGDSMMYKSTSASLRLFATALMNFNCPLWCAMNLMNAIFFAIDFS